MNEKDFAFQIERLKSVYGDKAYSGERYFIFLKEFADLPREVFEKTVTNLIATEIRPPMLNKFREAMQEDLNLAAQAKKAELLKNAYDCRKCGNVGVAYAKKKGEQFAYAFQCSCAYGRVNYPAYPEIPTGQNDWFF